jgi:hypothetical protein
MLEMIEKAFAQELLSVSYKASRLVDFAWTIRNIGGPVPVSAVGEQFEDAEDYVSVLSKAGVLRYAMGGFINRDQKKQSLSVSLSEDLTRLSSRTTTRKEFEDIVFRNHGDKLIPHCRTNLTEPLAVMLTSIIFYSTPSKPAFSNTIVRRAAKVCMTTHVESQNILEYYLHRFLGLVTYETGSLLNLSVRSRQRVGMYPKIWEMYGRIYQEKPREIEPRPRQVAQISPPPRTPTTKASEQEKKLRGYFPWLKL